MTFKVGDRVEWTSQAGGYARAKVGEVVEVVPPGELPRVNRPRGIGLLGRSEVSYVVRVRGRRGGLYWPRTCHLGPAPQPADKEPA